MIINDNERTFDALFTKSIPIGMNFLLRIFYITFQRSGGHVCPFPLLLSGAQKREQEQEQDENATER